MKVVYQSITLDLKEQIDLAEMRNRKIQRFELTRPELNELLLEINGIDCKIVKPGEEFPEDGLLFMGVQIVLETRK